ncbi:YajQ family cyclic di-GMP-binding protein [Sulfuriflexus mobilis]|uniref:YajQ family cyclic di-GMP-binding protein n=1 Tax=Sulfuriflexus mobilis TaxID=1811807 RepID=UPI000F8429A3|nr:YajQ family cyclic di-GMP-binding protein [Sulfuriflexus mobilis]
MPSFDIVSEVDKHELKNAVDQANREIGNRFDFKGSNSKIVQNDLELRLESDSKFRVEQVRAVMYEKLSKRGIDISCLDQGDIEEALKSAKQVISVRHGIDKEQAKKIVKLIKDSKIKVQAAIQGEQLRVTGKKRDELQAVMALLRDKDTGLPLQFNNFRD